ncbi:MAG: PqqD family peptide modification chaperone [Anaerolineae bacterium]|nr:PqqD family peptide modification chaperone [Anaerolineae bacterium]
MRLSSTPRANPSVVLRELADGEAVLVNLDSAAALALNGTSVVVWRLVDGKRTVQEIPRAVSEHFRDVPESVEDDVLRLLDLFAEGGFIGFEYSATR